MLLTEQHEAIRDAVRQFVDNYHASAGRFELARARGVGRGELPSSTRSLYTTSSVASSSVGD